MKVSVVTGMLDFLSLTPENLAEAAQLATMRDLKFFKDHPENQ